MDSTLLEALLAKAKLTLRVTTDAFDDEIKDIIQAGYYDLSTRGVIMVQEEMELHPMLVRAIMTYVRLHFGDPEDPQRLKASYDEQKGQLMITSGFTRWEGST